MKVLIIANARFKGGLSGSDAIYLSFIKYWDADITVWQMMDTDFKPFWLCYLTRILLGVLRALFCFKRYDFVYSASDFMMDSLPGFIMRLKGNRWVAGFYLYALRDNKIHYATQPLIVRLIKGFADVVCITNGSMKDRMHGKKTVEINGGIELSLAGRNHQWPIYDAVFCGRIHPSKGIDVMLQAWELVRQELPQARLAIIGDGDLGVDYIKKKIAGKNLGIKIFGYLGDERYEIYKRSRVVLYPAIVDHFSMAPVEAMACGCPMIAFHLPVMDYFRRNEGLVGCYLVDDISNAKMFARMIVSCLSSDLYKEKMAEAMAWAKKWDYRAQAQRVLWEIAGDVIPDDEMMGRIGY